MDNYKHLEMDDDDQLDRAISTGSETETPRYPYGLRFTLTHEEMAKLKMTEVPEKGDVLHFAAMAEVTNVSTNDGEFGKSIRLELQITHMLGMEDETKETPGRGK